MIMYSEVYISQNIVLRIYSYNVDECKALWDKPIMSNACEYTHMK